MLLTAALSFAGAAGALPLPIGSEPVRIGLIVLALVVGIGLTVALDRPGARPYWQITLLVTLVLMPVVALQASASRVPFVAISKGSAGPLLWFTLATLIALTGLWLFASFQSDQVPENGALLFLPAAVLVPAILGAPGSLDETSALTMLGDAREQPALEKLKAAEPARTASECRELGGEGTFGGMHWGTFRLTDEHPLEPPEKAREAWSAAGLPADRLWIPAVVETRVVPAR